MASDPASTMWGLTQISVKYFYPLPLVLAALEKLRSTQIFSWISTVLTIWCVTEKEMSGRLSLAPPLATIGTT